VLQQRPYTFAQTNLSQSFFACDKAADHTYTFAQTNLSQSFFACDKAADHTFRLPTIPPETSFGTSHKPVSEPRARFSHQ